jgi:TIR domain
MSDAVSSSQKPLAIHILLHEGGPNSAGAARGLATGLYTRLVRGARPTGIPVHAWAGKAGPTGEIALPRPLPLKDSRRNAVLPLVDQSFFDARAAWQPFFEDMEEQFDTTRDVLLPVSIGSDAHRVSRMLTNLNCIPATDPENLLQDERVYQAILTGILRLVPETEIPGISRPDCTLPEKRPGIGPPRVFLCHTKSDGADLALELRRYIYENTQLTCFFDTHDIPHGHAVRQFIQASLAESCLLVLWTDRLLESRWCQFEILEARRQQRPILIVDALSRQAPRLFPYFGNMPVVRWRDNPDEIVSSLRSRQSPSCRCTGYRSGRCPDISM